MANPSQSQPEDDKNTPETNPPEAKKPASNPEPTPAKSPESGTANKMAPPPKPPEPQPEPVAAKPAKPPEPKPEPAAAKVSEPKPEPVAAKPPEPKPEPVAAKPPEPKPEPVVPPESQPKLEPATQPKAAIAETTTGTPETAGMDVAAIKDQVMGFISNLPQNAGQFFGEYSRPLTTVILIVVALVTLRVLAGVVDTVNQIPFVQPTLELVGIAFSVWFVYRYLLRSENRQELVTKFNALKAEVLGKDS